MRKAIGGAEVGEVREGIKSRRARKYEKVGERRKIRGNQGY